MSMKGAKYLPKAGKAEKWALKFGTKLKSAWTLEKVGINSSRIASLGWKSGLSTNIGLKGKIMYRTENYLARGLRYVNMDGKLHTGMILNASKNIAITSGTYEVVDAVTSLEPIESISDF